MTITSEQLKERVDEAGEMLTVPEAADIMGRSRATIRRWIKNKGLPAERVRGRSGHEYRIDPEDLHEFYFNLENG